MTTHAKGNNNNLLLLGGVAAIAAVFLLKNQTPAAQDSGTSGGGSGGFLSDYLGGTGSPGYGGGAPTIYNIPPSGDVKFPDGSGNADIAALLALLNQGKPDPGDTKKDTATKDTTAPSVMALDAGQALPDGTILKKPFISSTTTTKKAETIAAKPDLIRQAAALAPFISNPVTMPFAIAIGLGGFIQDYIKPGDGFGPKTSWQDSTATLPTGPGTGTVNDGAPAGTIAKKDAITGDYVSGFSGQYINTQYGGFNLLKWNGNVDNGLAELGGFGLSRDPQTGRVGAYQRDVFVYGPSGLLYNPHSKKGDAMVVADIRYGTFTSSKELAAAEIRRTTLNMYNQGGTTSPVSASSLTGAAARAYSAAFTMQAAINAAKAQASAGSSKKEASASSPGSISTSGLSLPAPFMSGGGGTTIGGRSNSSQSSYGSSGTTSSPGSSGTTSSPGGSGNFGGGGSWNSGGSKKSGGAGR